MTPKSKVIAAVLVLAVAFAIGRYTAPIRTEIKTVEVEHKVDTTHTEREKSTHRETTETEVVRPDGTKEKTKKTTEDSGSSTERSSRNTTDSSKSTDEVKEVGRSTLTVSALIGIDMHAPTGFDYGVGVNKQLLGPVSIGLFGFLSGNVGVSVGLSF